MYQVKIYDFAAVHGGEGGIRTHGCLAATPVFKTGALDRYATSPRLVVSKTVIRIQKLTTCLPTGRLTTDN